MRQPLKKENESKLLSRAIDFNDLNLLKQTLDSGVHPDTRKHKLSPPPLFYACRKGRVEIANELIHRGADYKFKYQANCCAFLYACENGMFETVRLLLQIDKELVHRVDDFGMNGFIYASLFGHMNVMKLLIEYDVDAFKKENDLQDALMNAAMSDQVEAVKLLLDLGFVPNIQDIHGTSTIGHAIENEAMSVIRYFIRFPETLNEENKKLLNTVRLEALF
jgi:ankyrin repeat protein